MNKIRYTKGYKYKLEEDYSVNTGLRGYYIDLPYIKLDESGLLTLKKGYACDGPTWSIDTKTFMRAAFGHDGWYQLIREGLLPKSTRRLADKELVKVCKEDKMIGFRRWYVYKMVRKFGDEAIKPREVFVAP